MESAGPVQAAERISALDAIRGIALVGVIVANLNSGMVGPLVRYRLPFGHEQHGIDYGLEWLLHSFVHGKFFTMFSLLFGVGFAIFLDRARARGAPAKRLFLRRITILFVFGAVHSLAVWWGDILAWYAVMALVLLAMADVPGPRLWRWGAAVCLIPVAVTLLQILSVPEAGPAADDAARAAWLTGVLAAIAPDAVVYTTGSWWAVAELRARELVHIWRIIPGYYLPTVFGMFLIGAGIARCGLFTDPARHRMTWRCIAVIGLGVGVPLALYATAVIAGVDELYPRRYRWQVRGLSSIVSNVALCLGYTAAFVLLLQRFRWRERLATIEALGRLALTNYLMHSLVFTWIFYGYGLGLAAEYGRSATTAMALALVAFQLWFSGWWLERYRIGPMEWLWRTLTYGRVQSFRVAQSAA